jgi:hypothetical protein
MEAMLPLSQKGPLIYISSDYCSDRPQSTGFRRVFERTFKQVLHHGTLLATRYSINTILRVFMTLPDAFLGPPGTAASGLVQRGYLHSCRHNTEPHPAHSVEVQRLLQMATSPDCGNGSHSACAQWVSWYMHCCYLCI